MKVYIASPFFNPEQLERIEYIENILQKYNINCFSPRKDTYVTPTSSDEERKIAFDKNLEGIQQADFILVVTDGKDVGTIFEAGYAYSWGTPILYFAETLADKPFNLMLAMSGHVGICKSRQELEDTLHKITDSTSITAYMTMTKATFNGEIE